jgi:hypothetical protein
MTGRGSRDTSGCLPRAAGLLRCRGLPTIVRHRRWRPFLRHRTSSKRLRTQTDDRRAAQSELAGRDSLGEVEDVDSLLAADDRGSEDAALTYGALANPHTYARRTLIASARVTTDRHRHRDHKIKTRRAFPHAPRGITTRTAPAHVCGTAA